MTQDGRQIHIMLSGQRESTGQTVRGWLPEHLQVKLLEEQTQLSLPKSPFLLKQLNLQGRGV
jgi:hypothetical protein